MACSRKGWRCQAKSDFSVFPHSVSCQATARAQAYSVQCFLANVCFWTEISSTRSTGPCAGLSPQLSHQLCWSPPAVMQEDPTWESIPDVHPTSDGGFLKSFLPNPHGWGTYEILESSFSLTVCSIFGFWSHSVDFADKRKLQNFIGMSQHGLESGCKQHLRIRLSPVFPT